MTPAERMDLALCGGYEWIDAAKCDECGSVTTLGKWVPVEMPRSTCRTLEEHEWVSMWRIMAKRQMGFLEMAPKVPWIVGDPGDVTFIARPKLNIPMPRRYEAPK